MKYIDVHKKWKMRTSENFAGDIALVMLDDYQDIMINNNILPVCLPFSNTDENRIKNISFYDEGAVAGWGVHGEETRSSNIPRLIKIPIVNTHDCMNKLPALSRSTWSESFCAGSATASVCQGDSGSGYYVEVDKKYYIRGIVSNGVPEIDGSCRKDTVALYSDVLKYKSFIQEVSYCYTDLKPIIMRLNFFNSN